MIMPFHHGYTRQHGGHMYIMLSTFVINVLIDFYCDVIFIPDMIHYWTLQLSQEAVTFFDATFLDMDINIDHTHEGSDPLLSHTDYVETMQISLWETTFFREFVAKKGFHMNNKPYDQLNFKEALGRVLY